MCRGATRCLPRHKSRAYTIKPHEPQFQAQGDDILFSLICQRKGVAAHISILKREGLKWPKNKKLPCLA